MRRTPQLEDGYVRIANKILEDWLKLRLSPYQWAILHAIIRFTYGFNQKESKISVSFLAQTTGIHKANVSRALRRLVEENIIIRRGNFCAYNKNSNSWRLKLSVETTPVISRDNKKLSVETDYKYNIKTTIKDNNERTHHFSKKTLEEYRGLDGRGSFSHIGELLEKPTKIKAEWQECALRIIKDLGIANKRKSAYFKVVRDFPRSAIIDAFSFAVDYPKPEMRDKIFFWRLNRR